MNRSFVSRFVLAACAVVALCTPQPVFAVDASSWFATLSVGQSKFKGYELEAYSTDLDDTDTAWMVHGGYRFGAFFAASAGYADLGTLEASGSGPDVFPEALVTEEVPAGDFRDEIDASGIVTLAHGILPIGGGRVQIYFSGGAFAWEQDVAYEDEFGPFNESASGVDPCFGVGVNVFFGPSRSVSAQAGWMRFLDVGDLDETGHENDIDFFGASLVYHFGN